MPSVLTTSTLSDYIDVRDLPTEPLRAARAQKGLWRTLAQYVAWFRVRKTHRMQHLCAVSYGFETPVELFARQYPASYLQALSGL
jgi:hypothetical protein